MFQYATQALERLLVKLGLDPSNVTYDALFNRLLDLLIANITFANVFFAIGGISWWRRSWSAPSCRCVC